MILGDNDEWYLSAEMADARNEFLTAHESLQRTARGSHAYPSVIARARDAAYFRLMLQHDFVAGRCIPAPPRLAHVSAQRSSFQRQ